MRMTPQPPLELFDASWTAERLREVGVCLTDRNWAPLGPADDFFVHYALPALRSHGAAAGVVAAVAEVESGRRQRRPVGLVAYSGRLPKQTDYKDAEAVAGWTHALPAYTQA